MGDIRGRIDGDKKTLDQWSNKSKSNSYHTSKSNAAGGSPNHQTKGNDWFTPRKTACNCGPIGKYPGSDKDRG